MLLSRVAFSLLVLLPAGYAAICALLYFYQDRMVFLPSHASREELVREAEADGFALWTDAQGRQIGWQSQEGDPLNVLLICNGNGGYALHRTYYRDYCRKKGNWKVFLLEYPGYGSREGAPSEASLTEAAIAALDELATVPGRRIRVLGESLGSGTACALARARPARIDALLLVTPFNSLVAAAGSHYPWLPVSLFLKTRFDSEKNLAQYPGPVAFFLAAKDTTVPATLGQKLYDSYPGRKRLWIEPEGNHDVSPLLDAEWPQIVAWLQSARPQEGIPFCPRSL